jgi:serine/threonine protein kinase
VERELGAGGTATVYLARDLRHKRMVALKVVRPELGGREGVERPALGRTYEAAGKPDSAALACGRFIRFWDKADPELQGRVKEAREALQEITRERPNSP